MSIHFGLIYCKLDFQSYITIVQDLKRTNLKGLISNHFQMWTYIHESPILC